MDHQKLIIIGATSGLGRALAIKYVSKGAMVVVTGRRKELLDELKEIDPSRIITSCFDVTANNSREKINELIGELGGLDLLIYNSGFGTPSEELDLSVEETTTKTNVNGFVEIAGYAFNYFVNRGKGQIALISSVAGIRGSGHAPAYSASKAFMSNYAEGLNLKARKLKKNVIITDIRPGFLDTKPVKDHRRFWVTSTDKAADQVMEAIQRKKRIAYISKRWRLVAFVMKILPFRFFSKLG